MIEGAQATADIPENDNSTKTLLNKIVRSVSSKFKNATDKHLSMMKHAKDLANDYEVFEASNFAIEL